MKLKSITDIQKVFRRCQGRAAVNAVSSLTRHSDAIIRNSNLFFDSGCHRQHPFRRLMGLEIQVTCRSLISNCAKSRGSAAKIGPQNAFCEMRGHYHRSD
ncbi:MAG TPA: hypothetical protein VMV89_06340 [Candidatus Paceibacterota bacterium]|nr:hypothetical protein [Candidatus Paceibacterota bacterium]